MDQRLERRKWNSEWRRDWRGGWVLAPARAGSATSRAAPELASERGAASSPARPRPGRRADPHVLLLPGLGGSGPGHWQTLWQARHPEWIRVAPRDLAAPDRRSWVVTLEATVSASARPVVLVAHSLGCALLAHWATVGSTERVAAALLVAPADVERAGAPEAVRRFAPTPRGPLPFPAWVVASTDDPHAPIRRVAELADGWGARLVALGARGHINVASGHGPWPEGEALLERLIGEALAGWPE